MPYQFTYPKEYYRVKYFEALDLVSEEISRSFDQASLALPKTIEELLITACNIPVERDVAIPDI